MIVEMSHESRYAPPGAAETSFDSPIIANGDQTLSVTQFTTSSPLEVHEIPAGFTATQLYESLPLAHELHSIRVLDLSRARRSGPNMPLTGHLRVVNLKDCPAYTALSYVWGASGVSDTQHTIFCNDCAIPITKNCHTALCSLRSIHGSFTIWVDSICNNQADEREQESQIPLMEEIYTWAQTVYVWLGSSNDATDRAIRQLRDLSLRASTIPGIPWFDGQRGLTGSSEKAVFASRLLVRYIASIAASIGKLFLDCTSASLPSKLLSCLVRRKRDPPVASPADFQALLDVEWLRRSWTFQELILASNPVFVCGSVCVTWAQLRSGLRLCPARLKPSRRPQRLVQIEVRLPSNSLKLSDEKDSLFFEPLDSWKTLFSTWYYVERPVEWHEKVFRRINSPRCDPTGSAIRLWSVASYQRHFFDPREILARVMFFSTCTLVFLSACLWMTSIFVNVFFYMLVIFFGLILLVITILVEMDRWQTYRQPNVELWPTTQNIEPMEAVIQALRERHCDRAHDKAYALYGVLRSYGIILPSPDYGKSPGQVYKDLFIRLVQRRRFLINLLIDVGPQQLGLPSWVPDWSNIQERFWLDPRYVYSYLKDEEDSGAQAGVAISDDTVVLQGAILGTVTLCSGPFHPVSQEDVNEDNIDAQTVTGTLALHCWLAAVKAEIPINSRHTLPSAVLEVIIGKIRQDGGSNLGNGSSDSEEKMAQAFHSWYRIAKYYLPHSRQSRQQHGETNAMLEKLAQDPTAAAFLPLVCQRFAGRRGLFFSLDGYMGSGPSHMTMDDEIAILDGVSVPMILRPDGGENSRYRVIGPAFVHGLMSDEERQANLENRASITLV